ncbi:MAG TPA: Ppx/GppA phosphatase family protein [Nitrospiria bacterium]|nr:Ppx/GppA phosphatase family protein [Nitrospiria bacterium]
MAIIAGIDIGTNTLRLLISEIGNHHFKEIHSERMITRLGEGLSGSGRLTNNAVARTVSTLKDFSAIIDRYMINKVVVAATSAVREAENRQYFIDLVKKETGFDIEVISGEEEARRTFLGILHGLDKGIQNIVAIDIGGGSTEFICGRGSETLSRISIDLGVVKLTERHIKSDPILPSEFTSMVSEIKEKIRNASLILGNTAGSILVGTAGSITTLAAIDRKMEAYNPLRINNCILKLAAIRLILSDLVSKSIKERRTIKGLEPGREDIIVAGAAILISIMEEMGHDSLVVSDYGLREGLIIDAYNKRCTH